MKLCPLNEVLEVAGGSRDDFHNWRRRDNFLTKIPEGTAGKPLMLSRKAALETAFRVALKTLNIEPGRSSDIVRDWLDRERSGRLRGLIWGCNLSIELSSDQPLSGQFLKADESTSVGLLAELFSDEPAGYAGEKRAFPAPIMAFVDVADIASRVAKLFDEEGR